MNKFPGLCIGGPMDGKLHEGQAPEFTIQKAGNHTFPDGVRFGVMEWTYIHMPTDVGVHFWVLKGETPASTLTALAVHYMTTKVI